MSWLDDAACSGTPLDMFFPVGRCDNPQRKAAIAEAVAVCERCPVRTRCAQFALDSKVRTGVFAGIDLGDGYFTAANLPDDVRRALEAVAAHRERRPVSPRAVACGCGRTFTTTQARLKRCRPCIQGLTDVAPVRTRLNELRAVLSYAEIGELTGVPAATLATLGYRRFIKVETADLILSVRVAVRS